MRRFFSIFLFLIFIQAFSGKAQELRCNVQVLTQQIQGSNKQIFKTFQTAVYEFMNNRTWTQDVFDANEKIECNILINLTEQLGTDVFKGSIQVQSRRPVFNSTNCGLAPNLIFCCSGIIILKGSRNRARFFPFIKN